MPDQISAFVFDLDGVLVDTAQYHFESWRQLSKEMGFVLPEDVNDPLKGLGRMESLAVVLKYRPDDITDEGSLDLQKLAAHKNEIYMSYVTHLSPGDVLPGVTDFLEQARVLGLKLAVGSGSRNARIVLQKLGIAPFFDAICDGNDITRSKPDPEVFECACKKLNIEPSSVVIFEDAVSGIEAAIRCGAIPVGVGSPSMLSEAEIVISSFENLKAVDIMRQLKQRA